MLIVTSLFSFVLAFRRNESYSVQNFGEVAFIDVR